MRRITITLEGTDVAIGCFLAEGVSNVEYIGYEVVEDSPEALPSCEFLKIGYASREEVREVYEAYSDYQEQED